MVYALVEAGNEPEAMMLDPEAAMLCQLGYLCLLAHQGHVGRL